MKTATIRDLRNDFARLSKWLDKGETIEIIKRGKHVADLVPEVRRQTKGTGRLHAQPVSVAR